MARQWLVRRREINGRTCKLEVYEPLHHSTEKPICQIPSGFVGQEEDARLIAAAPDLLEACKSALIYLETGEGGSAMEALCDAIEEATGERP